MPVWETALWFTMVMVVLSVIFQVITRGHMFEEQDHLRDLANNNTLLAKQIAMLQEEIGKLNSELQHLTKENHDLNIEVHQLTREVARIRQNICIEDCTLECPYKG